MPDTQERGHFPVYRMHHEIDDWKLAAGIASGFLAGVLLCASAAVLAVM